MADEGDLVLSEIKAISTVPESYFQPSKELPKDTLCSLKKLFDYSRQHGFGKGHESCPLKELIVDGFDDEQIWQQIELQNEPVISDSRKKFKEIKKKGLKFSLVPSNVQKWKNGHEDDNESSDENLGVEFEDTSDDSDVMDSNKINNRVMMPASSSEDEEEYDVMADDDKSDDEISDNHDKQKSRKRSNRKDHKQKKRVEKGGSIIDDKFFKLSEMTEFLDKMDQDFERKRDCKLDDDDDSFDYFRDIESDEEEDDDDEGTGDDDGGDDGWGDVLGATAKIMGRDLKKRKEKKPKTTNEIKYSDYFDPPDDEKQETDSEDDDDDMEEEYHYADDDDHDDNHDDDHDDDSMNDEDVMMDDEDKDEKNNDEGLSRHEKEQLKMKKKIAQLEKENLTKKSWQMSGEAGGTARPFNSLLEEDLNFDHTTAVAPPITEETTKNLEDVIKQRIKDESWDDVERKQKPVTQPYEYKKKQPLDQEKSKLSLSQIYEQEYVKQTQMQDGPKEEEIEGHKEIKELMAKLFTKLDALSNFHFTPKPLKPEVKIVTNTPVISMEEVAPVVASDAMLLAPEEAYEKKAELKGDAEKTKTDRKRERRTKKLKQRIKSKEQEKKKKLVNKLNPGLGNKYAKKKALKELEKESKSSKNISVINKDSDERKLKSSSAFFSRLHDEVKQQVISKKTVEKKRKKAESSVSKLKL